MQNSSQRHIKCYQPCVGSHFNCSSFSWPWLFEESSKLLLSATQMSKNAENHLTQWVSNLKILWRSIPLNLPLLEGHLLCNLPWWLLKHYSFQLMLQLHFFNNKPVSVLLKKTSMWSQPVLELWQFDSVQWENQCHCVVLVGKTLCYHNSFFTWNMFIFLDALVRSITEYFYELCRILTCPQGKSKCTE